MVSATREFERTLRVLLLEQMQIFLRLFATTRDETWKQRAQEVGFAAKMLHERITSHSYQADDLLVAEGHALERAALEAWSELRRSV